MTVEVRSLPPTLAAVVGDLELEEASYVTLGQIREIADRYGISSHAGDLAWRLRRNGWLLPTPRRGVWEFAPAAHAGRYSRGDVFAVLRGELNLRPDEDIRVGLLSALWLRGWAERPPSRHELSAAPDTAVSAGLGRVYRVRRFESRSVPDRLRGLPVETTASTLVHVAARPGHVSSWESIEQALPDLAEVTSAEQLREEVAGRPSAVAARLGYLLHGVAPDLVHEAGLRPAAGTTRFGPRTGQTMRFDSDWNVVDTLLPFDPAVVAR